MQYREIDGNLIELALAGSFDVIAHGTNCFCLQGAGIAKQMSNVFDTNNPDKYPLELPIFKGNINKLNYDPFSEIDKPDNSNNPFGNDSNNFNANVKQNQPIDVWNVFNSEKSIN